MLIKSYMQRCKEIKRIPAYKTTSHSKWACKSQIQASISILCGHHEVQVFTRLGHRIKRLKKVHKFQKGNWINSNCTSKLPRSSKHAARRTWKVGVESRLQDRAHQRRDCHRSQAENKAHQQLERSWWIWMVRIYKLRTCTFLQTISWIRQL